MGTNFQAGQYDHCQHISIHVPHEGHDKYARRKPLYQAYFNPRAPRGARRDGDIYARGYWARFQSTCPTRGTTSRGGESRTDKSTFQSTCPARGTTAGAPGKDGANGISIHVPREGHDRWCTRQGWREWNFNPRAPRGARLKNDFRSNRLLSISIHVPREGHDPRRLPGRGV